jgi:hypothetical protein
MAKRAVLSRPWFEAVEIEAASMPARAAGGGHAAVASDQQGVSLQIEEKLNVILKKDGGLETMELQGTMMLEIKGGEEDAFIRVAVASGANQGFQFKTHPNIDKALHASEGILGLKDPNRPFPMGSPLGKAVQVDPVKPTLQAPGNKRLKLKYDELPSNFAFKFDLRRYTWAFSSGGTRPAMSLKSRCPSTAGPA